jgi:hypothetical protein
LQGLLSLRPARGNGNLIPADGCQGRQRVQALRRYRPFPFCEIAHLDIRIERGAELDEARRRAGMQAVRVLQGQRSLGWSISRSAGFRLFLERSRWRADRPFLT